VVRPRTVGNRTKNGNKSILTFWSPT